MTAVADDSPAARGARLCAAVYRAATAGPVSPPPGWVDPDGVSPWRDAAAGAAFTAYGRRLTMAELRTLYRGAATDLMDAVRPAAVVWAVGVLDRQVPLLAALARAVERDGARLHRAAAAAISYSLREHIHSASGATLRPDEAAALVGSVGARGSAVDRFERIRFTRAVRAGGDPDLRKLMAHPRGVRIVKRLAADAEDGQAYALSLLHESAAAIDTVRQDLTGDPIAIWRFPPAVAGAVADLGLTRYQGTAEFALAWAARLGRGTVERVVDVATNAVFALELAGGPVGRAIGAVLDVVLSVIGTAVSFLRELEQDQAGAASAFAPDEQKLSAGGNYLGTALQGLAAIAAAAAVPGALSGLSRRARRVVAPAIAAQPAAEVAAVRGVPPAGGRGIADQGLGVAAERRLGTAADQRLGTAADRGLGTAADQRLGTAARPGEVVAARAPTGAPAGAGPDIREDALALIAAPDELARLQQAHPLGAAGAADPAAARGVQERGRAVVTARKVEYRGVELLAMGQRERAIRFMRLEYAIDMRQVAGSRVTALGYTRNSKGFWRDMCTEYPHLFSEANQRRVLVQGRAPKVDDWWLAYHPSQAPYRNQTLVHHHVEQGPWAVGIPEGVHRDFYPELHPITNPDVLD